MDPPHPLCPQFTVCRSPRSVGNIHYLVAFQETRRIALFLSARSTMIPCEYRGAANETARRRTTEDSASDRYARTMASVVARRHGPRRVRAPWPERTSNSWISLLHVENPFSSKLRDCKSFS